MTDIIEQVGKAAASADAASAAAASGAGAAARGRPVTEPAPAPKATLFRLDAALADLVRAASGLPPAEIRALAARARAMAARNGLPRPPQEPEPRPLTPPGWRTKG